MNKPIRIQRKRTHGWSIKKAVTNGLPTVVVTRPSKWGNPFTVKGEWEEVHQELTQFGYAHGAAVYEGARQRAVTKFRDMMLDLNSHPVDAQTRARFQYMRDRLQDLQGKNVACWCPVGSPCHGDALLEIVAEMYPIPEPTTV